MKNIFLLLMLASLAVVTGCDSATKKSSSRSSNSLCTQNPTASGCGGNTGGGTGGSYSTTIPSDNNWADLYAGQTIPPESNCQTTGTGYGLRKGTITMSGGWWFSPASNWSAQNPANTYSTTALAKESQYTSNKYGHNVSGYFTDVTEMRNFLDSDSVRKVRFKVRPQVKPPTGQSYCYYRRIGQSADTYGYSKLRLTVGVRPLKADGTLDTIKRSWTVESVVNSCTPAIDMSASQIGTWPHGVVFEITRAERSDNCWYQTGCTTYADIPAKSCWQVDVEAAVDGTVGI